MAESGRTVPAPGRLHLRRTAAGAWQTRLLRLLAFERALFWVPAGLCIAGLLVSFVFDPFVAYLDWRDFWVHAAVLREWAAAPDLWAVGNPHYDSAAPSREYTPWLLLFVLAMRAFDLSPIGALQLAACVGTLLLYGGLYAFCTVFFRTRVAAALGLIAAFFFWGDVWEFVGFVNYRSQLFNNYYPATAALGTALILWALVIAELRRASRWRLAALTILFGLLTINHQLSAAYALGGIALFVLCEPAAPVGRRALIVAAIAIGGALAALWPLYDPWALVRRAGDSDPEWAPPPQFDRLGDVLRFMAPQFLGLAGLLRPATGRRMLPLTVGFIGCFGAFLVGNLSGNSLTHRFVPFAALFLSLGLTAFWLSLLPRPLGGGPPLAAPWRRRAIIVSLGLGVLTAAAQTGDVARDYLRAWTRSRDPIPTMFTQVTTVLPRDSVSMATPGVALSLTSYGRKVVVIPRALLLVPDEAQRRADARRFFAAGTGDDERRAILARWHATRIVVRTGRFVGPWWHDELPDATVTALRRLGHSRDLPHRFVVIEVE